MTTPKDYKSSGVDIEVEEKSISALVSVIKETLQFRKGKNWCGDWRYWELLRIY